MPDAMTTGAVLLVAGPVVGTICLLYPPLFRVWTAAREQHLTLVAAHPRAWRMANTGFTVATVLTAAGLAVLAGSVDVEGGPRAVLIAGAVAYAMAGALWCAVLAIRTVTTPTLAAMVASDTPTEPAESLLGAAITGLFGAFLLTTGVALAGTGLALALGGMANPATWLATLIAALAVVRHLVSGDVIPAVIYVPTLLLGITLLAG